MSTDERSALAVMCVCGGWVMLAVLGHNKESDRDSFKEAAMLAGEGFTVRTPVTVEECRRMPACKYRGDCTADPAAVVKAKERESVEQLEIPE